MSSDLVQQLSVLERELRRRFTLRMIYVISGFVCVLVGAGLSIAGYGGMVDFQLSMGSTFEARLGNATPGVVILTLGVVYSFIAALGFKVETSFREDGAVFNAYAGRGETSRAGE